MAKAKKVKTTTWKARWKRVQGQPQQLQVELRAVKKLTPASTLVLELQQALQKVNTLEQLLATTAQQRDRLHKQIAEMELEKEAQQRCERTAVQAQLGHRAYIYKGMVAAAKQHILAERRVKELEAEVACFKSVRGRVVTTLVLVAVGAIVLLALVVVLRRLARDNEPVQVPDAEPCYLDDEFDIKKTHADRVRAHNYRASIGIERTSWHETERQRKKHREQERARKRRQKNRKGGRS